MALGEYNLTCDDGKNILVSTYLCGPSPPDVCRDSWVGDIMSNWMGASGTKVASALLARTAGQGAAAPTGMVLCRETTQIVGCQLHV